MSGWLSRIGPGGHLEKWLSGLGALVGIAAVYAISAQILDGADAPLITAAVGASAVLLFALPHSPLSQPYPLVGGQLLSCAVGVLCARYLPESLAVAATVGIATLGMYYLRCLHPPGGATALVAVIGGDQIHALGFQLLLTPVLLNVVCLLVMATLFNYMFEWRRYPLALAHLKTSDKQQSDEGATTLGIDRADLRAALERMGIYVDVTEQDLEKIYTFALQHARQEMLRPKDIELGKFYSNGLRDAAWSVRRVIDESEAKDGESDRIIYRTVAGKDIRSSGVCSRMEFAYWARYEVEFVDNAWQRIKPK